MSDPEKIETVMKVRTIVPWRDFHPEITNKIYVRDLEGKSLVFLDAITFLKQPDDPAWDPTPRPTAYILACYLTDYIYQDPKRWFKIFTSNVVLVDIVNRALKKRLKNNINPSVPLISGTLVKTLSKINKIPQWIME
jgi:hypothetical protein